MKKMIALLLALIMVFSLVACSGSADTAKDTTTTDSTTTDTADTTGSDTTAEPASTEGSVINVCLASEPDTIDPALNSAVDGATMLAHLFSGLAKWSQDADGNLQIVADAATELPEGVENEDGTVTYTYTLRDGLKWSDGQDLKASDFVFAWKRAASEELGADYGYMFENVKGYPNDLAVEATDDKTIVVTLNNAVAYWDELLAFPAYFPVREDVVANEAWCTDASTFVSNGAYKMTGWDHNSVITLTKNGMSSELGVIRRILEVLERYNINVEYIPSGIDSVSLVVETGKSAPYIYQAMGDLEKEIKPDSLHVTDGMAVVAAVGRKMAFQPGSSGKIFAKLGENGINIRMITQGPEELNIIVGVDSADFEKAIRVLYNSFVK